ncbi:hypothetical protein NKR23_g3911 [Pleurostoma richardsiae]|uniref:Mitotic apparatus protein p62 n=1 Tax=Pleurostoma richardsiae TaxID=41990 RepID=A0AA38RWR5_9PEZI|nr:hypothetical protein NKR23_g3911 [Pleurostoma richardsiae]
MAAPAYLLRIPRTDERDAYIILGVTPAGSRSLDLKLEATEGTGVYSTSLKHSQIPKSRAKSGPCSESEWESILTSILRDGQTVEDIEVTAGVSVDASITLAFRKKIQAFGQRIGEFTLEFKIDEGIEMYDWCHVALASREELKEELAAATSKASDLEKAVEELNTQLEELIKAKDEEESALLEKFRDILNEKKLKIREQQRIIAGANIGSTKGEAGHTARSKKSTSAHHSPGPSRRSKRKADDQVIPSNDEEPDDGLDKMDVDTTEDIPLDEEQQTTEGEETETEGDEDEGEEPPSSNLRDSTKSQHKKEAPGKQETPPPPRRLPFGPSKAPQNTAPALAVPKVTDDDGSETESDDEL